MLDASGQSFGRLATSVVRLLRGKQKATFAPHIDGGDFVHVVHLREVRFTGMKFSQKQTYRHSGWPGGLKAIPFRTRWERDPERMFRHAVRGMLPGTRHRPAMLKRLTVEV